jgi:hypothetical protein
VNRVPANRITDWFSSQEIKELLTEIITKIQLSNINIGAEDDQLLLLYLINETTILE